MKCPICVENLMMSDRNGIEIDYCPKCRGIWLDRGELDKIIERSQSASEPQEYLNRNRPELPERREKDREYYHRDDKHYKHKKKSFLDDLFDF